MKKKMTPSGARKKLEDYYLPRTIAATHRLKTESETI